MSLDAWDPAANPAAQRLDPRDLADESVATVRRWLGESAEVAPDPSAQRLAGLLQDPVGLDFAIGFVDRVVRPHDLRVAGRNLERLSRSVPAFLPWYLRAAIVFGGGFAPLLPWPIVPIARWALRRMVNHLVIDATPARLAVTLGRLRERGMRLNLNLLGEAVLGDDEADSRLDGTRELLARPDVDYVSIKVSSVVSQLSMWAMDEMVERVVERLTPLYELAAQSPTPKFINLDMEEYRDLDLTVAVFQTLLEKPALRQLEAGVVLQAYLPDALSALQGLTKWATERRRSGGAGIKVRLVKGANLAMERVDATMHGWPLATWGSKRETDTNYKRVLDWALTPEHTEAVRLGVAGHNLFDVAFAWLLAKDRGVESRIEFEMLLGMATGQADAVRRDVGGLLLYTPVVHPREFDSAISYLIRRLEENASSENFMSGLFELGTDATVFAREAERFLDSLATLDSVVPSSNRRQNRAATPAAWIEAPSSETAPADESPAFFNEPDTDPAIAANRLWARGVLGRVGVSELGNATVAAAQVTEESAVNDIVVAAAAAGSRWGALSLSERAAILRAAAAELAAARADLIEVMASETGKTIAEGDVEVSEAIDFARYYADRTLELDSIDGATFTPPRVTLAIPPWNFPVAIPAGTVLAALAAGSSVIIKPAPQALRSAAVMVEALWRAGVPRDTLVFVDVAEGPLGKALIAHPRVDRVILTGGWETAELFRGWRADLPLVAETSGKNAIIVTPSADLDLAVADIVKSAFGHAGQKCSAASLIILVGSVARSDRFRRQLVDAVRTLRVGYPRDATTQVGPLVEPARGKLLEALTVLGEGESWLVEPRQLDDSGALWSPGVRVGVTAGSAFHRTEYFGPVLGIMAATTLDEAIDWQNGVDYGLTAGIHSLDAAELAIWLERVEAGNLYVNRGITGAIVQRQPFGGWKRSTVGPSAKAGGPNYLFSLGSWQSVDREPDEDIVVTGLSDAVASVVKKSQTGMEFAEFDRVRRAALSDQAAWDDEFGVSRDVSALGIERNVFRYRSVPVTVRLNEGRSLGDLIRLIAAASRTRSPITISTAVPLPTPLTESFDGPLPSAVVDEVIVETDAAWLARAPDLTTSRVRLIGGDPLAFAEAISGSPDVAIWAGPVTTAGRIELLPFLREQAVSITAHRFGNPDPAMSSLRV